ncbi:hypothetical protein V6N13_125353 [Hibiscus sabdariffa]|uniref:Uncharacterized protein n=1 Tax=Hibiscus sabdariffa TaxID=183260 RepID=A0ABR2U5R6_9ROSI
MTKKATQGNIGASKSTSHDVGSHFNVLLESTGNKLNQGSFGNVTEAPNGLNIAPHMVSKKGRFVASIQVESNICAARKGLFRHDDQTTKEHVAPTIYIENEHVMSRVHVGSKTAPIALNDQVHHV